MLHVGPASVALLAAAGRAAGAFIAAPLGSWLENRRHRRVMIGSDLLRFVVVASVPAAFLMHRLTFAQLVLVSVTVAAADIVFKTASGAYLKAIVRPEQLLVANGRFESTNWLATAVGPPLGGAAIGLFGPVASILANAFSYLLSALSLLAIGGTELSPQQAPRPAPRLTERLEGWRFILGHPTLRPLFFNSLLVNGLIMATAPPTAVLMLGRLGFAPWQYGLAFGLPCVGGLLGARLVQPLASRFGRPRLLLASGAVRACWPLGLAFIPAGPAGLVMVIVLQFCLIASIGIFNPLFATERLEQTPPDRIARTLSAWWASGNLVIAFCMLAFGALAQLAGPRAAIATAGLLLLATPLILLPRRPQSPSPTPPVQGR